MTISRQVAVAAIMVIVAVAAASDPSLTNTTNTTNTTTTATTTTTTTTNKVPPHHGNSSNANTLGTLKSGLMAGGWIPFTILVGVSFFFSFSYVRHYQHSKEREFGSTVITTLALAVGLLTIALVPVDIYLVSSLKEPSGVYVGWLSDTKSGYMDHALIDTVQTIAQDSYYAFYGLSALFSFFLVPLSYFFYEEKDEEEGTSCIKRLCHAMKFTTVFLFVFVVLLAIGAFATAANSVDTSCEDNFDLKNKTEMKKFVNCRAKFAEEALLSNKGMNALFFATGALTVLGYLFFMFYTAVGMVTLPLNMIRSRGKMSSADISDLAVEKSINEDTIRSIKAKYSGKSRTMSSKDRQRLRELESKQRTFKSAESRVKEIDNSCMAKVGTVCRPFTFVFGILFVLLSVFLVAELTISSSDKLKQIVDNINNPASDHTVWNWKKGYTATEAKAVNLLDKVFTLAANIFPVDYIIVTATVYYFVCATMSGVKALGVRFCHLKMFSIRAHRTVPQGLLFLSFILVFVILCLNVVLLTLSPTYTTYGNQMYSKGVASQWAEETTQCIGYAQYPSHPEQCSSSAPQYQLLVNIPEGCNPNPVKGDCLKYQVDIPLNKANATAYTKGKSAWSLTIAQCSELLEEAVNAGYSPCPGVPTNETLPNLLKSFESCEITEPCLKTRLAALLSSFFYNFWFLGFCYYWANWGFIAVFFLSLIWCTCKRRKSLFQALVNDVEADLLGDDDDDMTPFKPSWMA